MTNPYYTKTGNPQAQSRGLSSQIRAEFTLLEQGLDKLPTLSGNGTKMVSVNTGGTALEAVDAATARTRLALGNTDSPTFAGLTVGNVTPTEITYLDGVTSAIQTQIDSKATKAGETYTGTHSFTGATINVPTLSGGATGNGAASVDFVNNAAFSAALPGQGGNSGKYLITNGTTVSWNDAFASPTSTGAIYDNGSVRSNIVAMAALDVDCSAGNYFTKTINGNSTFTVSNVPSSRAYAFTLELTHTSGTVTWFANLQWAGGTAPTLTTGKTHLFTFVTDNGGSRWRGVANINYTN